MAGLVPAIHVFIRGTRPQDVDARDKRGHDGDESHREAPLASLLRHGRVAPAIHVFVRGTRPQDVDARDKRGHDDGARGHRWSLSHGERMSEA